MAKVELVRVLTTGGWFWIPADQVGDPEPNCVPVRAIKKAKKGKR